MAQTESKFITYDDYRNYRAKQDDAIQGEFRGQAHLIAKGNEQLRDDLGELNNELGQVKGELGLVKDELGQVKDELGQVNDELGQVKDELGQVKEEVGEIKARINQMDGRAFNRARIFPWHSISSIGIYQPNIGFQLPQYFPPTIKDFWNLQFPRGEKNLIYLLEFYEVQGYQQWGQANEDFTHKPASSTNDNLTSESSSQSDSDDSSHDLSLKEAVRKYPHVAIDELGSRIGLRLEDIRDFIERAAQ